jgi:hypothetical protein
MERAEFAYSLHALLRKRSADLDQLKESLVAATSLVAARERELQARAAQIRELEEYQRARSSAGAQIDVAASMRIATSLRSELTRKAQQALLLGQAQQQREQVIDELCRARQALKAVERHRERALAGFQIDQQRQALRAADELYLANRHAAALKQSGSGK